MIFYLPKGRIQVNLVFISEVFLFVIFISFYSLFHLSLQFLSFCCKLVGSIETYKNACVYAIFSKNIWKIEQNNVILHQNHR